MRKVGRDNGDQSLLFALQIVEGSRERRLSEIANSERSAPNTGNPSGPANGCDASPSHAP